jgi:trehalose 6-phosphate phosphatase
MDDIHTRPLPAPPLSLMKDASLFLDFDGTLVPLADKPEDVTVDPSLFALLEQTRHVLGGRLAIVSGRSVQVLRTLFHLQDFVLAGSHGLEFARPGEPSNTPPRPPKVDEAEATLRAFVADKPGLLVERKTLSVGLHFRQAPYWGEACREVAEALAQRTGLFLQTGKMLFELRPGGADKGSAIRNLMLESPLSAGVPLFMGDDVTDEDGFAAALELGGSGILIGPARRSAAQWRLEHTGSVRHYLSESVAHLNGEGALTPF